MMKRKQKVNATYRLKVERSKVLDRGLLWCSDALFSTKNAVFFSRRDTSGYSGV